MALSGLVFDFTYRSGFNGTYYYFTVSRDQAGRISVKNIQTPTGRIIDSQTGLPQSVTDDIQAAIAQVEDFVAQSSTINGNLAFAAETSKSITFAVPFASTNYRVALSVGDFIPTRVTHKTITGFTVETGVTYTGTIGYDVFV
jgi:hypothetical protein